MPRNPRAIIRREAQANTSALIITFTTQRRASPPSIALDYRDQPRRRLHNPRTERTAEKSAVTPTAMSVQMKKNAPLELATRLPCITPFPIMWRTGMTNEKSEARSMMTYPDRRPASTSVP